MQKNLFFYLLLLGSLALAEKTYSSPLMMMPRIPERRSSEQVEHQLTAASVEERSVSHSQEENMLEEESREQNLVSPLENSNDEEDDSSRAQLQKDLEENIYYIALANVATKTMLQAQNLFPLSWTPEQEWTPALQQAKQELDSSERALENSITKLKTKANPSPLDTYTLQLDQAKREKAYATYYALTLKDTEQAASSEHFLMSKLYEEEIALHAYQAQQALISAQEGWLTFKKAQNNRMSDSTSDSALSESTATEIKTKLLEKITNLDEHLTKLFKPSSPKKTLPVSALTDLIKNLKIAKQNDRWQILLDRGDGWKLTFQDKVNTMNNSLIRLELEEPHELYLESSRWALSLATEIAAAIDAPKNSTLSPNPKKTTKKTEERTAINRKRQELSQERKNLTKEKLLLANVKTKLANQWQSVTQEQQEEYKILQAHLSAKETEIQNKEAALQEKEQQLAQKKEEIFLKNQEIEERYQEVVQARKAMQEEAKKTSELLQQEQNNLKEKEEELKNREEDLERQLEALARATESLAKERHSLQEQNDQEFNERVMALEQAKENFIKAEAKLHLDRNLLQGEQWLLQEKIEELNLMTAELSQEKESLRSEFHDLQPSLADRFDHLSIYEQQRQAKEAELQQREDEQDEESLLHDEVKNLNHKLLIHEALLKLKKEQLSRCEKKLKTALEANEKLKQQLQEVGKKKI